MLKNKNTCIARCLILVVIFIMLFSVVSYARQVEEADTGGRSLEKPSLSYSYQKDGYLVTVSSTDSSLTLQYSLNGGTYQTYTEPIFVPIGSKLYARAKYGNSYSSSVNTESKTVPSSSGDYVRLPIAWRALLDEYRVILAGISGIGALSSILVFIIHMINLASMPSHPMARRKCIMGILSSLVSTALLGGITLILSLFYSIIFL